MKLRYSIQMITTIFFMMIATAVHAVQIEVYKSPACGCCTKWVEHLQANGFDVKVNEVEEVVHYSKKHGMPPELRSCHSARVNGYTIEGHVPAQDIKRLLEEKPEAIGLTVPGMPMGSPGMEGPRSDPYEVLLLKTNGQSTVYQKYAANGPVVAQTASDNAALVKGEVKKIDKDAGKITIKHGPITSLDMPPMTMVFRVKDTAMLDQAKVGDKINFSVEKIGGAFTITKLEVINK